MLYPKNIEQKIGFDRIRQQLKEHCISPLGQDFVDKIRFSSHYEHLQRLSQQTNEFLNILGQGEGFPQQNYIDARPHLKQAAIEGSFLNEAAFFELKLSLTTIYECQHFLRRSPAEQYPELKALAEPVALDKSLIERIDLVIDERGQLRDNASFELRRIRERIIANQSYLRKRLDQILKQAKQQNYIKEDASLTIREGRMVIPVIAEHKRKIKGFVHDESATGQTVYLEPAEIIDLNNEIRELQYEERREIIRILTQLTNDVRPHLSVLSEAYRFLGLIDFIRAKAIFAQKIDAVLPKFEKKCHIEWYFAKHPLLMLNFAEQKKEVVPLSIRLDYENRILLISGPNAGGKSVALKTVGLLQYMFQCGLLVPALETSTFGIFQDIFIDIGDEQSLENDLSTYSSHLTNMQHFLKLAGKKTLFLIDEFGTGTEPSMGGAIAETILKELHRARAFGVITTHYTNLKFLAENTEGLQNAAMQFDAETLNPAYQLEIGKPGSSFAFEIAQKIGLPEKLIAQARKRAGKTQVDIDNLLRELDIEKQKYHTYNQKSREKEAMLQQVTEEYEKLKNYLDKEQKRILNQARQKAKALIEQANQRIEQTIKEIKEEQAEKEATKAARQSLVEFKTQELALDTLAEDSETYTEEDSQEEEIKVIAGEIKEGDQVRVKGQQTIGEVLNIRAKDAEILIGDLKSTIKLNRLERISRKQARAQQQQVRRLRGIDLSARMANFSFKLDLRGKRAEEALVTLNNFVDEAILLGQPELVIVHGKGDGILRQIVREQLRKYKQVYDLRDEHADRGGAGVTLASLQYD